MDRKQENCLLIENLLEMPHNERPDNDTGVTGQAASGPRGLIFRTLRRRNEHFQMHSPRLAQYGIIVTTPEEYESKASQFLSSPGSISCRQCKNRNGDTIKFDGKTSEFASLASDQCIKTYFVPDPYEHMAPTNRQYFERQCVTNHEPCK